MAKHLLYHVNFRDPSSGEVVTFGPGDKLPGYANAVLDDPRYRSYWTEDAVRSQLIARSMEAAAVWAQAQAAVQAASPEAARMVDGVLRDAQRMAEQED